MDGANVKIRLASHAHAFTQALRTEAGEIKNGVVNFKDSAEYFFSDPA